VILSNPLSAPLTIWDHVVKALNNHGFRCLRYDQPGHGDSSAPADLTTTSFDSMADDVRDLLQSLKITTLHAWIGVSMGASVGFYFVTKNPGVVRKLVICDTISCSPVNAGIDDAFGPRIQAARQDGVMDKTVDGTMDRWFGAEWLALNPDEAWRVKQLMLWTSLDGFETCCHALRAESYDIRPLFGKVGGCVDEALCVVGEKDANLPQTMAEMRDKVEKGFAEAGKKSKVELVVVRNAGHVCFIDGQRQFLETVIPFLEA
jgi:pimeloyl-ACP methyl ester carboxylesterase